MYFVYGSPTMRLPALGVRISSADSAVRIHAFGLSAATALNRDHSSLMVARWSAGERPARARMAVSNIGYTWTGMVM